MEYIGIDGGLHGGLAALASSGEVLSCIAMPTQGTGKKGKAEYDLNEIAAWLARWDDPRVFLERAQAFSRQGVVSCFTIGVSYGTMRGLLFALHIPCSIIHPITWQAKIFKGMPKGDTKKASIATAKRLWPMVDFRATENSCKDHNGMTDAALIAEYGRSCAPGMKTADIRKAVKGEKVEHAVPSGPDQHSSFEAFEDEEDDPAQAIENLPEGFNGA
jgi:hypothetical protein